MEIDLSHMIRNPNFVEPHNLTVWGNLPLGALGTCGMEEQSETGVSCYLIAS